MQTPEIKTKDASTSCDTSTAHSPRKDALRKKLIKEKKLSSSRKIAAEKMRLKIDAIHNGKFGKTKMIRCDTVLHTQLSSNYWDINLFSTIVARLKAECDFQFCCQEINDFAYKKFVFLRLVYITKFFNDNNKLKPKKSNVQNKTSKRPGPKSKYQKKLDKILQK